MESLVRNKVTATQITRLEDGTQNPLTSKPFSAAHWAILTARRKLPVSRRVPELLRTYQREQVMVLSGDTGSGKSTQVPQLILYNEWASGLGVACAQPQVLAAKGVAERVANELDVELGGEVGYHVRFDAKRGDKTRLVYMTEGILIQEAASDKDLGQYACVIIDDAHERTVNTDILMALLKAVVSRREDFKVIIMSATLDATRFKAYFNQAPYMHIPSRTYPVSVAYLQEATPDYLLASLGTVEWIHRTKGPGDILVFLSGEDEIKRLCSLLQNMTKNLDVLPLYSRMSPAMRRRICGASPQRRCIVTTNIAKTNVTIDSIVYVVDPGLFKQMVYNPRAEQKCLRVQPISQTSARQRMDQAGRTQPGTCYRLYTKETYDNDMHVSTTPGILSEPLESAVLTLKQAGYSDIPSFDFIDRPHPESLLRAVGNLIRWGCLDRGNGQLTNLGRFAASGPVDPIWFCAIAVAGQLGCSLDMVDLAAVCSTQHAIFVRPFSHQQAADLVRQQFANPLSDHITYLNAFKAFGKTRYENKMDLDEWCENRFLNRRGLDDACRMRADLHKYMKETGFVPPNSCGIGDNTIIRKALARSMFTQVAIQRDQDDYRTVHGNQSGLIWPGSVIAGGNHEWIVYQSFLTTGKPYLQMVTAIMPEWLVDLPHFQDDVFPVKRNGLLRQPNVKVSLDRARVRLEVAESY